MNQFLFGFLLNFFLILIFCKIPVMSPSGWISAGILGTILWGSLSWSGWLSVVIYLILGSLVTKVGYKYKDKIGIAEKRGGRRGPENVWGSASTGLFFAIMLSLDISDNVLLKIGFAASFAAKLADTFGSEIGKRFGRNTFLITSFKRVKKGSEGGISLEGTLASLVGSIIMSWVMYSLEIIMLKSQFIIVSISGFMATIFESFIGAKFQDRFNLSNEFVNSLQTGISSIFAILIFVLYFK
tara:strand:+ start:2714 stop:3436 length:723 start_codon:yes stop_codon:yes gene_type:complete